jgi:glutamate 5-kinase
VSGPEAAATTARTVVVKIGSSSITGPHGIDTVAMDRLCGEVAELRAGGHSVVLVSSGAIAAGWAAMGGGPRPQDPGLLQAVAAVGQHRLMRVYDDALATRGLHVGQVLLAPLDFAHRQQYLHARQTLARLLELGVVPVVNENDATSDDEIRFGDNDRLAALVAHLVAADLLVLLTDTAGLLTADPKSGAEASLIEEVVEVDHELEAVAGGSGSAVGSGGMVSKLAAAKIAAWSGVPTLIADAARPGVLGAALESRPGVGTFFRARQRRLSARKLWIAFALAPSGRLLVDDGCRRALVEGRSSLLPAGVVGVEGRFEEDDAVEIAGADGSVFAKGLVRHGSDHIASWAGRRTSELPEGATHEVVHRDDLVVLH